MRPWYRDVLKEDDPALRAEIARVLLDQHSLRKNRAEEHVGRVIEFRRGKGHLCGVLRPQKGTQGWKVLDQEGKEKNIRGAKIIDISTERVEAEQRDEIVQVLRAISRRREAVKARLDLRTLWEVAGEAGERAWSLDELAELYFGEKADSDRRAALARGLDDGYWFIREEREFVARSAEVVAQSDRNVAQRKAKQQRLQEWATWLRSVADGKETERPEGAEEAIALVERAALQKEEEAGITARLMERAHLHGPLAAFDLLVRLGHWSADENLELRRHRISVEFSEEVMVAAEAGGWRSEALKSRRWRGGQVYGFSRDGEECDRAFSIRRTLFGYRVGVHFASPALLEDEQGFIDGAARDRSSSVHLPERVIPMLPAPISSRCRLATSEHRPSLTVELRYNRRFELKSWKVRVRQVRPGKVLDWEEAERQLAEDRHWQRLHALALALRRRRQGEGALILPESRPELRVRDGEVELQMVDGDVPARQTCEELTIVANSAASAFCREHDIPAVYRVDEGAVEILERGVGEERVWVHEQVKLMSRAALQTEPSRHHGLGVEGYLPANQPLHRYTDLMMHRQLVCFCECGRPAYDKGEMERVLIDTAWARQATGRIAAEGRRYWLLKYLEAKMDEELDAVVLERRGASYLVELSECRLKRTVFGGRELWALPGDRMRVKIVRVSARRDLLRLEEARSS